MIGELETSPQVTRWQEFVIGYESAIGLSPQVRSRLIHHDVDNAFSSLVGSVEMIAQETADGELLRYQRPDAFNYWGTDERLRYYKEVMDALNSLSPTGRPELDRILVKSQGLSGIYPGIEASTTFLENPTPEGYRKLVEGQTDLHTVINATLPLAEYPLNAPLNFAEERIIYNLLENAKLRAEEVEAADRVKVKVYNDGDAIVLENPYDAPYRKTPQRRLGELVYNQQRRNGRFGLFIVDLFSKLLGNASVWYSSRHVEGEPYKYIVDSTFERTGAPTSPFLNSM
jgi:hypothetical protein